MNSVSKFDPKREHKRQTFRQIWLPFIISMIVFVGLAIFIILDATPGSLNVHLWANISTVLLVVPSLFLELFGLALVILLIVGAVKAIQWLPVQIEKAYLFILNVSVFIWKVSDKIVNPVVKLAGMNASVHETGNQIRKIFKK